MSEQDPAGEWQPKSKEAALAACSEQHRNLVACFKTCSFFSAFTGCCSEEHKTFWGCYTEHRGTNKTVVHSWLHGGGGGSSDKPAD